MKFKKVLWIVLAVLAILAPFVSVGAVAIALPKQYTNTFVGELNEKYDRLNSLGAGKIVVVGGSSVAFGLDSETMEEITGRKVVNFGLYAALGTKLMLDLSKSGIQKGDTVILAPEMDAQTLSLYFSSENTLKALDDDFSMVRSVGADNWLSLLGGMWKFAGDKYESFRDGAADPAGVYNAKNFNEYGDVIYPRPHSTMLAGYDVNTVVDLSEQIVDPAFLDYLNDYIKFCKRRGAEVYFSFCPIDELALKEGTTEESILAFEKYLKDHLACELISEASRYILPAGYFYDTNFHLNDAGVKVRTKRLIEDLFLAEGNPTAVEIEEPEEPGVEYRSDVVDENEKYFTFAPVSAAIPARVITGLTAEGRQQTTLTIPVAAEGYKVAATAANAFAGSAVESIVVPAESFLTAFRIESDGAVGAFRGAGHLARLDLYLPEEKLYVVNPGFFAVSDGFTVHLPEGVSVDSAYNEWPTEIAYVSDLILPTAENHR